MNANNEPQSKSQIDDEIEEKMRTFDVAFKRRESELSATLERILPEIGNPPPIQVCSIHSGSKMELDKWRTVAQRMAIYGECRECDREKNEISWEYRRWLRNGLPKVCFGVKLNTLELNDSDRAAFDEFITRKSGFLVLLGTVGAGKTTVACAVLQKFKDGHYFTRGELVSRLRGTYSASWGEESSEDVAQICCNTPLLVLDEFEKADDGRDSSSLLFRIIDNRWRSLLPTIICGNTNLQGFKGIVGEAGFSRISGAGSTLVEFQGLDRRTSLVAEEFYQRQLAFTKRLDRFKYMDHLA